jgi:hypothetical protein
MERAARLIQSRKFSQKTFNEEDLARAVWPTAVGKGIAAHTSRVSLVRNTLVVEVADAIWQKQLFHLRGQILDRLQRVTGSGMIHEIEFRVAVPRRQPQRAASRESASQTMLPIDPAAPLDEAETIQDAVLKKVYRLSRKKATA